MTDKTSLSYKDAGVDIDAGNALVGRIKGVVKKTRRPEVMGGTSNVSVTGISSLLPSVVIMDTFNPRPFNHF